MKKTLLFAAVAAALVGCSKSEVVDKPLNEIGFKNSYSTKATTVTSGAFNVKSYKGATTFTPAAATIDFTDIYTLSTATTGLFTGNGGHRYYDDINCYSFFAWADGAAGAATGLSSTVAGAVYDDTTAPEIELTATTGAVDLVYAKSGEVPATQTAAVPLTFAHALTRVKFTANTETYNAATLIKVTKIEYTVNKDIYTLNMTAGTGAASGNTITYALTPTAPVTLAAAAAYSAVNNATTTYFYVVPQQLAAGATLKVEYTVDGVVATPKTFNIAENLTPNKSVNYRITINLREIKFTAEVSDWDADTNVDYEDIVI